MANRTNRRAPILRTLFEDELMIDNFAGGGGASTGMEAAIGRPVDMAINHSPEAIAMHKANHPDTKHYCENIWEVDPREACGGRPLGLAWFSPDCTHHSKAKGGKPRKKDIRGLAWVVAKWAATVQPRVIMLENVEEFESWGPLDEDGYPIKERAGETFDRFLSRLSDLGYTIGKKRLVAADYGTPTSRRRLFVIARRDGRSGIWPDPSHGEGRSEPWRTAAEIIDWSIPCPSIFARKKPLVEKTLYRIAAGIQRYVIEAPDPFIVPPIPQREDPQLQLGMPAEETECDIVSPTLIKYHGGKHAHQFLRPSGLKAPIATVDTSNRFALVATFLSRYFGNSVGQGVNTPAPTVMPAGQGKTALACAFLTKYYGTARAGASVDQPLHTVTGQGGHFGAVQAFLIKYYGTGIGQGIVDPLATVTTKDRFGLVTIYGEQYQIVDIGLRMLQPAELFLAQGFPGQYVIRPRFLGKPMTKEAQVILAGNAVCPQVAEALVKWNFVPSLYKAA